MARKKSDPYPGDPEKVTERPYEDARSPEQAAVDEAAADGTPPEQAVAEHAADEAGE